ncbi:endonuclease [Agrobacterium sp. a22-2]|uniref:endonuclease/exonuclease/phosphatase family protein n=1 Tax=Agrobacterium sp. a22-2 TaxID=2283840 RepID=UPI0014451D2E|nr:endonuclease/exonuclease/phosphatase family protein [Agrobacterium sp. a22-2]NKN36826.1 endonuclease [Agrobacterium sp. a22-2]
MKFASYNIQFGIGLDGKYDLGRIAASLQGADVIALQEVTRGFHRNGHADLPALFADLFPDYYWVYGPACDLHLDSAMVDGRRIDRRFQFGNMVLSRWPILANRLLLLPRSRTLDKLNLQRGATEAVITTPDGPLRVYSIHLDHVSPDERIAQIRYLKDRALHYAAEGGALSGASEFGVSGPPIPDDFILLGDFNMEPESPEYCEMAGRNDAYYGRTLRANQPVDAQSRAGGRATDSYTWMDPDHRGRRMHLDYGFLSGSLAPKLVSSRVDTAAEGSDHFPLWVEIG